MPPAVCHAGMRTPEPPHLHDEARVAPHLLPPARARSWAQQSGSTPKYRMAGQAGRHFATLLTVQALQEGTAALLGAALGLRGTFQLVGEPILPVCALPPSQAMMGRRAMKCHEVRAASPQPHALRRCTAASTAAARAGAGAGAIEPAPTATPG